MVKQRLVVMALIFLIIISCVCPPIVSFGINKERTTDFSGPGKHQGNLYIGSEGSGQGSRELVKVGDVNMWNTRSEFIVSLETTAEWKIKEIRVFVGTDPIPVSTGGAPKVGAFPFGEKLEEPSSSYELSLDLLNDLDFSWGKRKAGEHIQNVCVYAKLVGNDDSTIHDEAWASGEKEFEKGRGWWTRYALSKPRTGHFVDSPVGGVKYNSGSQKGKTNVNGAFDYIDGEMVSLNIGSLYLGKASAQHRVTILDLIGTDNIEDTRVVNLARLLQSLDEDGDPKRGITITEPIIFNLEESMNQLDISEIEFGNTAIIDNLIDTTVLNAREAGIELTVVSSEEAIKNLKDGIESEVFRKNISKTPEMETAKAKLELMPAYVPARRANGNEVTLVYEYVEEDGSIRTEERTEVKPLVSVYADEIPGTDGAMDVFGAVSRDEGETWKVTNLSRSADKSSFKLENGYEFPGDVLKPNIKVKGNKIMAVWTSRYAKSGNPTYALSPEDEYYEPDIWGVGGPQRSTDYTDLDFPEVGELPYHCVWICRGFIDTETGEIVWFKPERLTSGRRDAYQIMANAANNAGFALVWQEDPEGVRPGEMAGPGHGWSGATTNHKTDVWYSYIKWDDFDKLDENFVSGGDPQHSGENEEFTGRPKALVPFSLPVRISDNDTLNSDSMKLVVNEEGPEKDEEGNWKVDPTLESGKDDKQSNSSKTEDQENGESKNQDDSGDSLGSHAYGYLIPGLSGRFVEKINHQGDLKWVAVTEDGRLMDGDTGASRPNIMMQPYKKSDGTFDAYIAVIYEETKGVGSGPPDDAGKDDSEDEFSILSGEDAKENDGEGAKKGLEEYVPDKGKNIIYHAFTLTDPEVVSGGSILNPQATDEEGNLLYLEDEEGNFILDFNGEKIPAYENARRPRLLIQSKNNALEAVKKGDEATVMVTVFKMGEEGKGRPSDIFMRRWVVVKGETPDGAPNNPYDPYYLHEECQNISSVEIDPEEDIWINPKDNENESQGRVPEKVIHWEQTEDNLGDFSWTNPYDDARAHRGFIKGNFLAIAYDWTPNWASARNGNDIYNLYIRRSFDGGATWTTDPEGIEDEYGYSVYHTNTWKIYDEDEEIIEPMASEDGSGQGDGSGQKDKYTVVTGYGAGDFEPARNMSQVVNTKETVIEPRLVGVPGTIEGGYPEDIQNADAFWITYGTHSNPGRHSEEEGVPLDLYYSYSTDCGETYYTVPKVIKGENSDNKGEEVEVWDWLAKDTGKKEAEQAECQIRMTSDGSIFYAVWNDTGEDGSDVFFRRIMRDGGSIEVVETPTTDTIPPVITITGISDGDIRGEDIIINISLNEAGTWTAYLRCDGEGIVEFNQDTGSYTLNVDDAKHSYVLTVDAIDSAGNNSTKEISFTLDRTIPIISIEGVEDNEITNEDKTIIITTTGNEDTILLTKNELPIENFASGDKLSEDGVYILQVSSTNTESDITSSKSIHFIIDKEDPNIIVTGVTDGSSYTGKKVTPIIDIKDNHSLEANIDIQIVLNDNDFESGTTVQDVGDYILVITAEDEAGNEISKTYNFTIEKETTEKRKSNQDSSSSKSTEAVKDDETTEIVIEENSIKILITKGAIPEGAAIIINPIDEGTELTPNIIKIGDAIYSIDVKDENGNIITETIEDFIIELSYEDDDIPEGVNEENLKICYWDKDANIWIALPSEVDTVQNKITATSDNSTIYGIMLILDFPVADDIKGHWAEKDVYRILSMRIASGGDDGNLRLDDRITREEFAKLIVLASGIQPEAEPVLSFEDEHLIADWARGYVAAAVKAGIIQGYDNNTFCPKKYISRVEIATVLVKALNMTLSEPGYISFEDANEIPQWGTIYVAKAAEKGIITGFSDGTFKPSDNATRAQVIVMISRMLDTK